MGQCEIQDWVWDQDKNSYIGQNRQLTKLNLQSGLDNHDLSTFDSLIRSLFMEENILVKRQDVSFSPMIQKNKTKHLYINVERIIKHIGKT